MRFFPWVLSKSNWNNTVMFCGKHYDDNVAYVIHFVDMLLLCWDPDVDIVNLIYDLPPALWLNV